MAKAPGIYAPDGSMYVTLTSTSGVVAGPTSSTDNNVPRFDGTGGQTLQGSAWTIDDTGDVSIASTNNTNGVTITNANTDHTTSNTLFKWLGSKFGSGTLYWLMNNIGDFITSESALRFFTGAGGVSSGAVLFGGFQTPSTKGFNWSQDGNSTGTADLSLTREAANSLGLSAGANGQKTTFGTLTEITTIAASATTDTTIQIPAGALVYAVSSRVTTVIPTATTFDIGISGATTRYGTGISTAANTTSPGTLDAMRYYASATNIRITPNLTPGSNTGRIRVTIHYILVTPPTS